MRPKAFMQKNKIYKFSTIALSIALLLSLATSWKVQRDVDRELRIITGANELLRKTLGDLTVAITEKNKEIERLGNSSCDGDNQKRPSVPSGPAGKKTKEELSSKA